jgi:hypothetical protein
VWKGRNNVKRHINKVNRQENNKTERGIKGKKIVKKEMTVIKHVGQLWRCMDG